MCITSTAMEEFQSTVKEYCEKYSSVIEATTCFNALKQVSSKCDSKGTIEISTITLKELDLVVSVTKKIIDYGDWTFHFAKCILELVRLTSNFARINKKLIQVLGILEKKDPLYTQVSVRDIIVNLETDLNDASLITIWCSLIDSSTVTRSLVWEKSKSVFNCINSLLRDNLAISQHTVHQQDHLHALIKLILQICQYHQEHLYHLLWKSESLFEPQEQYLLVTWRFLIDVLHGQDVPRDCVLLSGTAVCFMLTCNPNLNIVSKHFINLMNMLGNPNITWEKTGEMSKPMSDNNANEINFGHLALINGVLSSSPFELLMAAPEEESEMLLAFIFRKSCGLCYLADFQYHSLKLLHQLFLRLGKGLKSIVKLYPKVTFFGSQDGMFTMRSLRVIWTHLDSPVDGVNEFVTENFKLVLELHSQEIILRKEILEIGIDSGTSAPQESSLYIYLLPKVLAMSWQVKGKHTMLAALMMYHDAVEILEENPDIMDSLLDCLATNYLAPASTHLYKAILTNFEGKAQKQELWKKYCLSHTMKALSSSNSLLRHNFGHHWLPLTLKLLPQTVEILLSRNRVTRRTTYDLHALVSVLKAARNQQLNHQWPIKELSEALACQDDDVRMDAFSLLCVSPKTSEPLSETEIELLMLYLPQNMNIDSPPSRQQLTTNIRSFLVRLRDSALSLLRPKSKHKPSADSVFSQLIQPIDFVQWLYNLCISNINPGSSYQRLKSSLDWLMVLLDVFVYNPNVRASTLRKKGTCPETAPYLVNLAQENGRWDFFSSDAVHAVLSCLLNGTDEIRESASRLLLIFFPWPLNLNGSGSSVKHDANFVTPILLKGLELCNDPRARECESGAVILKFVFERAVCNDRVMFPIVRDKGNFTCGSISLGKDTEKSCIEFIKSLLSWIEEDVSHAEKNVLVAARRYPSHGFLLAIQRCLSCSKLPVWHPAEWRPVLKLLLKQVDKLISLVMDVFGGKVHGEESAPSFEQMSLGIQQVIQESGEDVGMSERDEAVLSTEHQMINTWCWLNIKECSILLGRLGMYFSQYDSQHVILMVEDFTSMTQLFFKILTKCRHRGAIEGCNVGFIDLCSWLLKHPDRNMQQIPSEVLNQVLNQITTSSAASVTRRSAGLPLIVQSILASESKIKQSVLLTKAVNHLMAVISEPVPDDPDQTLDIPQVHAMNVLKAVFRESSLSQSLMPFMSEATIHAISGFASPFWAVRNASTQLFGTLISRMLGQKKTKDDSLNTTTAPDFFTLYPKLYPFLLDNITESEESGARKPKIHPCLFPVLAILARLGPGVATEEDERLLLKIQRPIVHLASSPLFAVRELAAKAIVPLTALQITASVICELLRSLPEDCQRANFNQLHGQLLQIEGLLNSFSKRSTGSEDVFHKINENVKNLSWVALKSNPCLATRTVAIRILFSLEEVVGVDISPEIEAISTEFRSIVIRKQCMEPTKVGLPLFLKEITKCYLTRSDDTFLPKGKLCLSSDNQDIMICYINWIKESIHAGLGDIVDISHLQKLLIETLKRENLPYEIASEIQTTLIKSYLHGRTFSVLSPSSLWDSLIRTINIEINCRQAALSVAISAIILADCDTGNLLQGWFQYWTDLILQCSNPENSEWMRYNSSLALGIAGRKLIRMPFENSWDAKKRILSATVCLLMDEQQEVRFKAADFVSQLFCDLDSLVPNKHPNHSLQAIFSMKFIKLDIIPVYEYLLWLCDLLKPSELDPKKVLISNIEHECTEMFESQEINPYWETCTVNKLILNVTRKVMNEHPRIRVAPGHLGNQCKKAMQMLNESSTILNSRRNRAPSLNVTCSKRAYEILHGLISWCAFLYFVSPENKESLHSTLSNLFQNGCLHPELRSTANLIN